MAERLTQDRRFKAAVESVRAHLTKKVLAQNTDEAERAEALRKYHLIDDVVAALASAEQP